MPRGGTFFKALCRPTVEQTCGRPAMCETGTVPEMVRRLDLPLLSRDGSIIWGSYAMALPTGCRNETPASRRDATGIQWYSVDRLQTDGQGAPSLEVPQHTKPKQGESGMVAAWGGGALVLSPAVREKRREQKEAAGRPVHASARIKLQTTIGPACRGCDCGKWPPNPRGRREPTGESAALCCAWEGMNNRA